VAAPTGPFAGLPPEWPEPLLPRIREAQARSGRKLVALDDDPTGVQTVSQTPVLARWEVPDLAAELRDPGPLCFVLTNSRSLPEADAAALNREIAANLLAASRETVLSRSDSTLRGHFPAETDALAEVLGGVDALLLAPAFVEGGRLTAGDTHWVRDGERWIPAAESEFALDASFGYRSSDLRAWVEERTGGRIPAAEVASLALDLIRGEGADGVARALRACAGGQVVVVNAVADRDLEVVALGSLLAEAAGIRLLARTAASFVRIRAGQEARPLLSRDDLLGSDAPAPLSGLVVVGSHVGRTGQQLAALLEQPGVVAVELSVPAVLDPARRGAAITAASRAAREALGRGETPVLVTTREVVQGDGPEDQLRISQSVSAALVSAVRGLGGAQGGVPGWVVGKGGITSSDVGTEALGARRAIVLGQVRPGVPVWRLGPETRYPGLPYVVFPGNVGGPETLAEVVALLRGA
jgi:uncharacterized protein YgbK (DUF1537 family)